MSIVVFENPGEIDPLLISTFGVSVKEHDNPIGFFGTGLKYALAILLRTGHEVSIQSGERVHVFGTREQVIRSQPFKLITMDGEPMGFTDAVGKTWELWMAYRELHCNTKDEGGSVFVADDLPPAPAPGFTRVVVRGDAFRQEHDNRSNFILMGDPWLKLDSCEVYEGESRGVFYRGILVHRLPKAEVSRYTYNITSHVELTEDRTAKFPILFPMWIAGSILAADDERFLRDVLALDNHYYEHHFDFRDVLGTRKTTPAFLNTVESLVQAKAARTNVSAQLHYRAEKRADLHPATTVLVGVESDILVKAVKFCERLGFMVAEYPIEVTDALGPNILGMAENGRIYVSRRAFMQGTKRVAGTLIEEFIHLRYEHSDESRGMQEFLLDRLVSVGEQMQGEPL